MKHHGEHVRKVIRDSGLTITALCKKIHKSRRWVYDVFEQKQLSVDILMQIGKALNYDLISDFPEFAKFNQSPYGYSNETAFNEDDHGYWKDKYYGLLEKYSELLARELESKDKTQ